MLFDMFKNVIILPTLISRGKSHDVVAKELNCKIVESEFKLHSCYYVRFQTNSIGEVMNSFIVLALG